MKAGVFEQRVYVDQKTVVAALDVTSAFVITLVHVNKIFKNRCVLMKEMIYIAHASSGT